MAKGSGIRKSLGNKSFGIKDITVSRKMRRSGPFASSVKEDAHISLTAIIGGAFARDIDLNEILLDKMYDIFEDNGSVVSDDGSYTAPPWAPLSQDTIKNKMSAKIMAETGTLIDHVGFSKFVTTRMAPGGVIYHEAAWPEDPHPNGDGLTVADIAAIHEFGATGSGFEIPPRPWLSRAVFAIRGMLEHDTVAMANADIFNASRALEAVARFQK